VQDATDWLAHSDLYDIADLLAFEDRGEWLYVAGDCSRSYRKQKLEYFTRQIVYLRPGTFVVFDRVRSTGESFRKDWLLQAMTVPERRNDGTLVISNGLGRLFVNTLLPAVHDKRLIHGDSLYVVDGRRFKPELYTGPAPLCRIEISPSQTARTDYFLHVLTATDSTVDQIPEVRLEQDDSVVRLEIEGIVIAFAKLEPGGWIDTGSGETKFVEKIVLP
jgi:hypothetical protein